MNVWDVIFTSRAWGRYPSEDLIRFVAKHYYKANRSAVHILDLGCGPGAGASWYCAREGFALSGIDGSNVAIEKARQRFADENLTGSFRVGDIKCLPYESGMFDAVLDLCSIQHNNESDTKTILGEVHRVLKPGGRLFSFAAKSGSWGDGRGTKIDETSYIDVQEGPFHEMGMGVIRFATEQSIHELYGDFELTLEYTARTFDGMKQTVAHWIISGLKRS